MRPPLRPPPPLLAVAAALVALLSPLAAPARARTEADATPPTVPRSIEPEILRGLAVEHDGRWMPLDTAARDLVRTVTGEADFFDLDPVVLLLSWTFDAERWRRVELFPIPDADLRSRVQLPTWKESFSYDELVAHRGLHARVDELALAAPGAPLDPLLREVKAIERRLVAFQGVLLGLAIRPIPPHDPLGRGGSIPELPVAPSPAIEAARTAWSSLRQAFLADDGPAFARASARLADALSGLPSAAKPPRPALQAELRLNRRRPFRLGWVLLGLGALLSAAAARSGRRTVHVARLAAWLAAAAVVAHGLWTRGEVGGRLPGANAHEVLLLLGGALAAIALAAAALRRGGVATSAAVAGALALLLADVLPLDPFVRPLPPVLADTVWLSIHVPLVVLAFAALATAALLAHASIVRSAFARPPARPDAIEAAHETLLRAGTLLLFLGLATGCAWAAAAWGRPWGFDPKEVATLVALLSAACALLSSSSSRANEDEPRRPALVAGAILAAAAVAAAAGALASLPPVSGAGALVLALGAAYLAVARGRLAFAMKGVLVFWVAVLAAVGANQSAGAGLHTFGFDGEGAGRVAAIAAVDVAILSAVAFASRARRRRAGASAASGA